MLFSNSPVKKVVEKLNPFSQKNKVSRLKFERKSDYRTFLKFIKDNTKEIEDIDISGEDKKRKGLMIGGGILGLALLGSFGRGKDDSDDDTGKLTSTTGVVEKAISDTRKVTPDKKIRRDAKSGDDILDKFRVERRGKKKFKTLVDERRDKRKKFRKIQKQLGKDRLKSRQKVADELINEEKRFNIAAEESAKRSRRNKTIGSQLAEIPKDGKKINKKFVQGTLDIEPPRINDKNFNNLRNLMSGQFDSDDLDEAIKAQREDKSVSSSNKDKSILNKSLNQPDASRVNPYNRYDPTAGFMDDDLGQRTGKTTDKVELNQRRTRATIDRSKFFEAPEVPKKITPKQLNNFDKFNRFSNRILNSPAAKFTTFLGGMFSNPKLMILKSLMEPTPLADGTLEGKPGVSVFSQQLMFDEDAAVNIFDFSEGRKSAIPFDANIKEPLVSQPSNLQAPINDVFIDFEFNTTEDLFFMKMGGS